MQQVWSFSLGLVYPRLLQFVGKLFTVKAGQVSIKLSVGELLMSTLLKYVTHPAEWENNGD